MRDRFIILSIGLSLVFSLGVACFHSPCSASPRREESKRTEPQINIDESMPGKKVTTIRLYASKKDWIEDLRESTSDPWLNEKLITDAGSKAFDREKWSKPGNQSERLQMLFDLVRSYPLIGMTHHEVTRLLGYPTRDEYAGEAASDSRIVSYDFSDRVFFQILYGGDGVRGYRLIRDTPARNSGFTRWIDRNYQTRLKERTESSKSSERIERSER